MDVRQKAFSCSAIQGTELNVPRAWRRANWVDACRFGD